MEIYSQRNFILLWQVDENRLKFFYVVHFIEYAIFNKSKKVSFYFGVGKRWIIVCKINCQSNLIL